MPSIPAPDDLFIQVIIWLGAPAIFVFVISFAMASASWLSTIRDVAKYSTQAGKRTAEIAQTMVPKRIRYMLALVITSAIFVALTYSGSQLGPLMFEPGPSGHALADGVLYDMNSVWSQILTYDHWTSLSQWAVLGSLASVVLVNFSNLSGWKALKVPVYIVWTPVLFAGAGIGLLAAIVGLMVFLMGIWQWSGYTPQMAILYGIWVVILFGAPLSAAWALDASQGLFSSAD